MELLRTCILVPCYKRPEYTAKCIKALQQAQDYPETMFLLVDDGSNDDTAQILLHAKLPKEVIVRSVNIGLRATLLDFIEWGIADKYEYFGVMGNDCLVPKNWLNRILLALTTTNADIISPNVLPSNAAFVYGSDDTERVGYRPASIVGGLWFAPRKMFEGIKFEHATLRGISGAEEVLRRIILEKEPKMGWLPSVNIQDIGHWSGAHADHVKSEEHRAYSQEVGRAVAW